MAEAYFSERDRRIFTALRFDARAQPAFDVMRDCLVWPDERPEGMTPDGHEKFHDLLIARAILYHWPAVGRSARYVDADLFKRQWEAALAQTPEWPGFRRLALTPEDRAYYLACLDDPEPL